MFRSLKFQAVLLLTALIVILLVQIYISRGSLKTLEFNQNLLQDSFSRVQVVAAIERDLMDLQRTVLIYKETASEIALTRFDDLMSQVLENVKTLEEIANTSDGEGSANRDIVQRMQTHLKDYEDNFQSVVSGRRKRSEIFNKELLFHFDRASAILARHRALAELDRTAVRLHLANAKSYSFQYLITPDYEFTEKFYAELATTEATLKRVINSDGELLETVSDIKSDFNVLSQVTRGYVFLVNVVMTGSANEFLIATRELRENYLQEQVLTKKQVQGLSQRLDILTSIVSVLCIVITLFIAYFIIARMLTPVRNITTVFKTLTEGGGVEFIPGSERQDEIGMLAKAADIFRKINDQTRKLLEQAKDLNKRQEELNAELSIEKDKAEQATQLKSMFLANMSHEIRTPMNGIIGLVDLALNTESESKQKQYLHKIAYSGEIMMNVINDILDFSKIEAGKLEIENAEFDIDPLIENLIAATYLRASEKGLNLRCHMATPLPEKLIGDALRINQVLLNLCNNAIKFTESGCVDVWFAYEQTGQGHQYLSVAVQDTGIGMSQDQVARIFESFQQADGSTSRKYGGTGLGLAIVKQLVDLMHGEISVESEPGVGSRFNVKISVLPCSDAMLHSARKLNAILYCTSNQQPYLRNIEELTLVGEVSYESLDNLDISTVGAHQAVIIDCPDQYFSGKHAQLITALIDKGCYVGFVVDMQPMGLKDQLSERYDRPVLSHPFSPKKLESFLHSLTAAGDAEEDNAHVVDRDVASLAGHVLLVEDNDINQIVAGDMLEEMGLSYDVAENGLIAVKMVEDNPDYDLVLMDIQMPVMDGYEATRQIRARGHEMPICALTANAMQHEMDQARAAGITDYITKPIDWDQLEDSLKKLLA